MLIKHSEVAVRNVDSELDERLIGKPRDPFRCFSRDKDNVELALSLVAEFESVEKAKEWVADVVTGVNVVEKARREERERIIAALDSAADKWRKGGCSQPDERAIALELFAAELRKEPTR